MHSAVCRAGTHGAAALTPSSSALWSASSPQWLWSGRMSVSPGLQPHDSACHARCSHAYAWLLPLRLLPGPVLPVPPLSGLLGPPRESCWRGPGPLCRKGKPSEGSLQGGSLLLRVFRWTGHGGWCTHRTWAAAEVPAQPGAQPGTCTWLGSARLKA